MQIIKIPADDLKKVEEFFQILFGLVEQSERAECGGCDAEDYCTLRDYIQIPDP